MLINLVTQAGTLLVSCCGRRCRRRFAAISASSSRECLLCDARIRVELINIFNITTRRGSRIHIATNAFELLRHHSKKCVCVCYIYICDLRRRRLIMYHPSFWCCCHHTNRVCYASAHIFMYSYCNEEHCPELSWQLNAHTCVTFPPIHLQ